MLRILKTLENQRIKLDSKIKRAYEKDDQETIRLLRIASGRIAMAMIDLRKIK